MSGLTYKDAGVDIDKGDALVARIKEKVKRTYNNRVYEGVGGFASLYEITNDKLIAAGTDGVGTKLKLAIELNIHNTIGIDLVAMCANDILCTGAKPLFFLDYLATSKLNLETSSHIIDGIVEGCTQSEMALIGGETAEMPGMYEEGDYDLAGFAVGEVMKSDLLDGSKIVAGDKLVAIQSNGFHSNGYSLLRKLVGSDDLELKKDLLKPTKIYAPLVNKLSLELKGNIHGLSHITGGGIENIPRMNSKRDYQFTSFPDVHSKEFKSRVGSEISEIVKRANISDKELYRTFNMGMGLVICTDRPELVQEVAKSMNLESWVIGHVNS